MARPRSEERRSAILAAAARVIATEGLGATTAAIAQAAGVSNGSLFLYFDTKATLINELFVQLKVEMGRAASDGLPVDEDFRTQLLHVWNGWLGWATSHPEKRRALAQLQVSDEITAQSHAAIGSSLSEIAVLLETSRVNGPMKDATLGFVLTLTTAVAEATIDSILADPAESETASRVSFEVIWRMLV